MIQKIFTLFSIVVISLITSSNSIANSPIPAGSLIEPAACEIGNNNACASKQDCACYCSVKCGFRQKVVSDKPVYIENDPNGIHCYCKEWDRQTYKGRCIEGKIIPRYKTN